MELYLYQDVLPWVVTAISAFTVSGLCFGYLIGQWHERRRARKMRRVQVTRVDTPRPEAERPGREVFRYEDMALKR